MIKKYKIFVVILDIGITIGDALKKHWPSLDGQSLSYEIHLRLKINIMSLYEWFLNFKCH